MSKETFEEKIRNCILEATVQAAAMNKDGVVECMKRLYILIELQKEEAVLEERKRIREGAEKLEPGVFGKGDLLDLINKDK